MAKFTSFDAPTEVAGPIKVRRATADDFGIGKEIVAVGSSITDFGKVLKEREDKRSITSARAQFSEFQLKFQKDEILRQSAAPVGAPGHFEQSKRAFDDGIGELTRDMNDIQKFALSGVIATARVGNLTTSMRFQAQSIVKGDLHDISVIKKGINAQLYSGTLNLEQGLELFRDALIDSTIGADGQQDLVTKALPVFRKQILDGALVEPLIGLKRLREGGFTGFPPDELVQFKKDLVTRINGTAKRRKAERVAKAAQTHATAFDLATGVGSLAEVDAASVGLPPDVRNMFRKLAMDRDRPVRTIEEKNAASADLLARYAELGVKIKKGRRSSDAALEDLLKFQRDVTNLVSEGLVSSGEARRVVRNVEEILQKRIGDAGAGIDGWDFFDIYNQTPFNIGMDRVNEYINDNSLGAAAHVDVARRFHAYLDSAGVSQGSEQTESRDERVNNLADLAIKDYIKAETPATRGLSDVPNAIISNGKVRPGAPGKRDLKSSRSVGGNTRIEYDRISNTYGRVTRDKDGNVVDFEQITKKEALAPPSTPVSSSLNPADGRVLIDPLTTLGARDGEDGASTPAPGPRLGEVDAGIVMIDPDREPGEAEDEDQFHQRLAKAVDEEVQAGTELIDPDREQGSLTRIPPWRQVIPSEQAISLVQADLLVNEGTGDNLTGIPTGEGGITEARKLEIERRKGRPLTDEQARNEAVREDSVALHDNMQGFDVLSPPVQAAVLDLAYSVGINNVLDPAEFGSLRIAIAEGHAPKILEETLDTAIVDGKSVKGLALRRARMFNKASTDFRITAVEQLPDGTINYLSGTEVLLTFRRPRHPRSEAGKESVN